MMGPPAASGVPASGMPVPADPVLGVRRIRTILILGALSALAPLSLDAYLPALPSMARSLAASASAAQLTLTACLFGLAAGQVLAGPLSDRFGRRRPLLAGLAGYAAASLLCALAPSVWALIALRALQGACGAAGIVIARAVVRDLYNGAAAARFFSTLMLVNGLAPILAPIGGARLMELTAWRGVFVALAALVCLLLLAAAAGLPETLPAARRRAGGWRDAFTVYEGLLSDRLFVLYVLAAGLPYAAMFAYIAGSPFVLQDIFGMSPQAFSVVFATNALGIMVAGQTGGRLAVRVGPRALLTAGLVGSSAGSLALLCALLLHAGLPGVLPALFMVVASVGLVMPNVSALALADHADRAGAASGLLGLAQFAIGGAAAPLVGVAGTRADLPMALIIAGFGAGAAATAAVLRQRLRDGRPRPAGA